jgi:hypothetical protein
MVLPGEFAGSIHCYSHPYETLQAYPDEADGDAAPAGPKPPPPQATELADELHDPHGDSQNTGGPRS